MAKNFLLLKLMLLFWIPAFGQMYDVVFSELMVRPAADIGLPNAE